MPSCDAARPGHCPCCGAASRPIGKPMVLVGHGLVRRQVLGPQSARGTPVQTVVTLRRYRCRACKAVLMVGPRGLVSRRWYSGGAIALALVAYGAGETSAQVRLRTSPFTGVGTSATERWATLERWIEAARRGQLFAVTGLEALGRRRVAEQVSLALSACGGRALGGDPAESAFEGAAIAA